RRLRGRRRCKAALTTLPPALYGGAARRRVVPSPRAGPRHGRCGLIALFLQSLVANGGHLGAGARRGRAAMARRSMAARRGPRRRAARATPRLIRIAPSPLTPGASPSAVRIVVEER